MLTPYTSEFRKRRVQNWVLLGLMYGFFYMSRYNLSAVIDHIMSQFGWTYDQRGTITAAGLATYGFAVFLNGPLADRIGGKKAILIGALGAALFNVLFGLGHLFLLKPAVLDSTGATVIQEAQLIYGLKASTVIAMFAVIWAGNHYFQSFGALSIVKVNAAWFHLKERGKFAGLFGVMIQSGRLLAFAVLPFMLLFLPWQYIFFIPAAILLVMWVLCYKFIEDTPILAGYNELSDTGDESVAESQEKATLGFILKKIFVRPEPWLIAFTSMCIGVVRSSIDQWYFAYFKTVFHIEIAKSFNLKRAYDLINSLPTVFSSVAMSVAAVLGGLASGYISDRFFSHRRGPVIFLALIGQAACLVGLGILWNQQWPAIVCIIMISFFVQSSHSLIGGASSMDFGGRKAVATAAGLFDGAQYLAGGMVSYFLGKILKRYKELHPGLEFSIWPWIPLPFALLGALLIAFLWKTIPGKKRSH